jgi:hypothetical protein
VPGPITFPDLIEIQARYRQLVDKMDAPEIWTAPLNKDNKKDLQQYRQSHYPL